MIQDRAETILAELVAAKGGSERRPQVMLTRGMADHAQSGRLLFAEAPTGVGKSLAVIATALASQTSSIVSTFSHALQQQLLGDLEKLSSCAGGFTYAVMKGRSSYLCHKRAQEALGKDTFDPDAAEAIKAWQKDMEEGEIDDFGDRGTLPYEVSATDWAKVSATPEQCAGKKCPFFEECYYERAKVRASQSDIVVANHALVAQAIKNDADYLSHARTLFVDECHEFPNVVGEAFGAEVSQFAIGSFAREVKDAQITETSDSLFNLLKARARHVPATLMRPDMVDEREKYPETKTIDKTTLARIGKLRLSIVKAIENLDKDDPAHKAGAKLMDGIDTFLAGDTHDTVTWIELNDGEKQSYSLRAVMFNVGAVMSRQILPRFRSVQFLSATIRVGGKFDSFARRLGVANKVKWTGATVANVFDYDKQGMVWLPGNMKHPSDPGYSRQVGIISAEVALAAGGRTLVLCTSWKAVSEVTEALKAHLEAQGNTDIKVLRQKRGQNIKVAAHTFANDQRTVLVGTRTLWAGVSFEGDSNIAVVIDKIPFPHPDDPVIKARTNEADSVRPGAGFAQVSVPEATLTIVQGAGRLIRTVDDRGIVVLCDPRLNPNSGSDNYGRPLYKASYAPRIMESLPPMRRAQTTAEALGFLKEIAQEADERLEAQAEAQAPEEEEKDGGGSKADAQDRD